MKIGTKLDNGGKVLDFHELGNNELIILAERESTYLPYVTYRFKAGACFWGNYHRHLSDAKSDFRKRCLTYAHI